MEDIKDIARRIKGLRQLMEITIEEMAEVCGVSPQAFSLAENGESDFSFTFLFKCANRFGVDITELISGDTPKLSLYMLVENGKGLPIQRRAGFEYQHLAYLLKNRLSEPFKVIAPYSAEAQEKPITLSSHKGQEFDYVLKGSLKFCIDGHTSVLKEGDSIYYDSSLPHGMIATDGSPCEFLAIVFKQQEQK